jgi:hypothetical protein
MADGSHEFSDACLIRESSDSTNLDESGRVVIVAWNGGRRGSLDFASGLSRGEVGDASDDEACGSLACRLWSSEVG